MGLIETIICGPKICARSQIDLQARTLAVLNEKVEKTKIDENVCA